MIKHSNTAKRTFWLAILIIFTVLITRAAFKINEMSSIYYEREFNATFQVGNFAGFSADTDVINFGAVTPGGSSSKEITAYHEYEKPLAVKIRYTGSIARVLSPVESFYLEPGAEKKISLNAHAGNAMANYSGKIRIMLIKR